MSYKKCGFKEKVNVCGFKAEDCNPKECDMYNIKFTAKDINKQAKLEKREIIRLTKDMRKMKKNHEHKTKAKEYKAMKKLRKDKVIGMVKLSKAYMYCKRIRK